MRTSISTAKVMTGAFFVVCAFSCFLLFLNNDRPGVFYRSDCWLNDLPATLPPPFSSDWVAIDSKQVAKTNLPFEKLRQKPWVLVADSERSMYFPDYQFDPGERVFLVRGVGLSQGGMFSIYAFEHRLLVSFGVLTRAKVEFENVIIAVVLEFEPASVFHEVSVAE
jgi:hypothetical protein